MHLRSILFDTYLTLAQAKRFAVKLFVSIYRKLIDTPYQPLAVYKVMRYAIDTDNETDVTEDFLGGKCIAPPNGEVNEFRIQWLGRKYRFVTDLPNNYPSVSHCMNVPQLDQMAVKAVLLNPVEGLHEDVLDRVHKFNGPCFDRFGLKFSMRRMFIHDELDEATKLMVITRYGDIFSFGPDDVFDLKK